MTREDRIYLIDEMTPGSPAHVELLKVVKPTAQEVTDFYLREGGNPDRCFEQFGIDRDELGIPRGE